MIDIKFVARLCLKKVANLTGASYGIGRAYAIAFVPEGVKIVVTSRQIAEGKETVILKLF